jgi:hypothetical protein
MITVFTVHRSHIIFRPYTFKAVVTEFKKFCTSISLKTYENRFAGNIGMFTKTPNFPAALFTVLYSTPAKKSLHNFNSRA